MNGIEDSSKSLLIICSRMLTLSSEEAAADNFSHRCHLVLLQLLGRDANVEIKQQFTVKRILLKYISINCHPIVIAFYVYIHGGNFSPVFTPNSMQSVKRFSFKRLCQTHPIITQFTLSISKENPFNITYSKIYCVESSCYGLFLLLRHFSVLV